MTDSNSRNLDPIFGVYCRTQSFRSASYPCYFHLEACLDDPVKKTWSVRRVVETQEPHRRTSKIDVHAVAGHLAFKDALQILCKEEKDCLLKASSYHPAYPDPLSLGALHFKAFAEREGYVFNIVGTPHARPNAHALPEGHAFDQKDAGSANRNLQRADEDFDANAPSGKIPNTHFLFDQFARAAHNETLHTRMNDLRALQVLDRFAAQIETAHAKMTEYCDKYAQTGQGGLIVQAENALDMAEASLQQLRAYGVNVASFDSFVLQCRISAQVLHAEGLYDLMNKRIGDFDQNEAQFKQRVTQAIANFKKIDASEDGIRLLENMIVQSPKPAVPAAIGKFIAVYKEQRADFDKSRRSPPPRRPRPY